MTGVRPRRRWRTFGSIAVLVAGFLCCSPFGGKDGNGDPTATGVADGGLDAASVVPFEGGAAGCGGGCSSEVLLRDQVAPWQIAFDDDSLYITNQVAEGSIVSVLKDGGGATVLAAKEASPEGIAVDTTAVYWAAGGAIRRVAKSSPGTASTFAAAVRPTTLLWNAGRLYWFDTNNDTVVSCSATNGGAPAAFMGYQTGGVGLAGSANNVYWTAGLAKGYVATCPTCGASNQPPTYVATGISFPQGIAFNGDGLFFAVGSDTNGFVVGASATPGADAAAPLPHLADNQNRPFAVAADGQHVYFTVRGSLGGKDGAVMRVGKDGSNLTPLATGLTNPAWLALDGAFVYWTSPDEGTVRRTRIN